MKFPHKLEPSFDLNGLRLGSEDGKWEMGIRSVMFGQRVSLTKVGNQWYTLDYCAADDQQLLIALLVTVGMILDRFPEDTTERKLQDAFPRCEFKPIKYDRCWGQLYEMAYGIELPSIQCPVEGCGRFNYESPPEVCPSCREAYPGIVKRKPSGS